MTPLTVVTTELKDTPMPPLQVIGVNFIIFTVFTVEQSTLKLEGRGSRNFQKKNFVS